MKAPQKPQLPSDPQLDAIRKYVAEVDKIANDRRSHAVLLATVEDDASQAAIPTPWRRFGSINEVQHLFDSGDEGEVYYQAWVICRNETVVKAQATYSDRSGDWTTFVDYYYSEKGDLVQTATEVHSFPGDTTAVYNTFYLASGAPLKTDLQYFELYSGKELREPNPDYVDQPPPIFLTVASSPFRNAVNEPPTPKTPSPSAPATPPALPPAPIETAAPTPQSSDH